MIASLLSALIFLPGTSRSATVSLNPGQSLPLIPPTAAPLSDPSPQAPLDLAPALSGEARPLEPAFVGPAPAEAASPAPAIAGADRLRALLADAQQTTGSRSFEELSRGAAEALDLLQSPSPEPGRRFREAARATLLLDDSLSSLDAYARENRRSLPILRAHMDLMRHAAALETLRAALLEMDANLSRADDGDALVAADRAAIRDLSTRLRQVPARAAADGTARVEAPTLDPASRAWLGDFLREMNPDAYDHPGPFDPRLNRHLRPDGPRVAGGLRRARELVRSSLGL